MSCYTPQLLFAKRGKTRITAKIYQSVLLFSSTDTKYVFMWVKAMYDKLFGILIHALRASERSRWIDASMKFLVSNFCDDPSPTSPSLSWHDVVPREEDDPSETTSSGLKWDISVWPLQVIRQTSRSTLLVRSPLS